VQTEMPAVGAAVVVVMQQVGNARLGAFRAQAWFYSSKVTA